MASLAIDQAFLSTFINANLGLAIAHENLPYTPVTGTPYAELIMLQNDITPWGLSQRNQSDGLFRVILRYPVNTGAIVAKTMADSIFAAFPIGARISYANVVRATITSQARAPGYAEEGWYKLILSLGYQALLSR